MLSLEVFFHCFAVSLAVMHPRRTRNSLESSVPPVSSAPVSTASITTIAVPISAQVSCTPASASILPEFLASVIQAIQTPISAIVQQSLSAVVSAHSVSQGLPAIAAQGSSLATPAAHFDACGFHQPSSPAVPTGCLQLTSSSSTPPVPAATPAHVLTGMSSSSLVVPSFVPVFSSASLSSIAPCSAAVYSLPSTINSALASHPIVSPTAFPSLTALPLQQPFVVGPGYSPVPFKVVSQITAGKFVNLEDLSAENITMSEEDPQLLFNGQLVLSHMLKKRKRPITDTASWMEAFSIFYLVLCLSFRH